MATKYYDPNKPYWLNQSIARAERRLEALRIRQKIAALDEKLKMLDKVRSTNPRSDDKPVLG